MGARTRSSNYAGRGKGRTLVIIIDEMTDFSEEDWRRMSDASIDYKFQMTSDQTWMQKNHRLLIHPSLAMRLRKFLEDKYRITEDPTSEVNKLDN